MSGGKHGGTFEVIERGPDQHATSWLATCKCKVRFVGATYEEVEDKWRQHVHETTGVLVRPCGDLAGRWTA